MSETNPEVRSQVEQTPLPGEVFGELTSTEAMTQFESAIEDRDSIVTYLSEARVVDHGTAGLARTSSMLRYGEGNNIAALQGLQDDRRVLEAKRHADLLNLQFSSDREHLWRNHRAMLFDITDEPAQRLANSILEHAAWAEGQPYVPQAAFEERFDKRRGPAIYIDAQEKPLEVPLSAVISVGSNMPSSTIEGVAEALITSDNSVYFRIPDAQLIAKVQERQEIEGLGGDHVEIKNLRVYQES